MKQHIDKSQWDELSDEQKLKFIPFPFDGDVNAWIRYIEEAGKYKLSIGQMIEFLGDDWYSDIGSWYYDDFVLQSNDELADALWEAVKEKLNK